MLELFAVLFTVLSVWLTRKQNVWCWVAGCVATACYFFIFKADKSYGNMLLQLIFIGQCFYGWVLWDGENEINVTRLDSLFNYIYPLVSGALFCFVWALNLAFDAKMGYLDVITTTLSIVALILTANKKIENWYYWAIADFIYVIFFITTKHYWSSALYIGLLVNTYFGFKEWKKQ